MNIVVNGTEKFQDYATFMRAVVVAIDECLNPDDNRLNLYSTGGYRINQYTAEFINRSERFLKQKGIKARYFTIPKRESIEKFDDYDFNMVLFLSGKSENAEMFDSLVTTAQNRDVNVSIYKV